MKHLLFAIVFALLHLPAKAEESCSIQVNDLLYHYGECRNETSLKPDRTKTVEIGQGIDGKDRGYWALIQEKLDGSYVGHWNGVYGSNEAKYSLGQMIKEEKCWVGESSRICLGVSDEDVATYEIHNGEDYPSSNSVVAYVKGSRYIISNENWGDLYPYKVGPTEDLDGDGTPETIIALTTGGNCCPDYLSIISYRGDGFFEFVNEKPIPSGWGGYDLVSLADEKLIRVHNSATGVGNVEDWQSQEDYALRDGRLVRLVERFNRGKPLTIMELSSKEVRDAPGGIKSLDYDLDLDGKLDNVRCEYWDRWGSISCEIRYTSYLQTERMTCRRLGIVPEVRKGLMRLSCD